MTGTVLRITAAELPGEMTRAWLEKAAADPLDRHPSRLPETLDFTAHVQTFLHTFHAAPPGTELGFPIVLDHGRLEFPQELASQSRYSAFHGGGRFLGTFHVHPPDRPPFFDPQDLSSTLRSDNAGFLELLLARDRLYALVRANPYLYISGHHVTRNPLLLAEPHAEAVRRLGSRGPEDPEWSEHYRRASLYYFSRYHLALYEGDSQLPLRRTITPPARW